ncbi:SDR family NAD(P)-dependent oxidoreductase [Pyxidicoccus parkwayensis]|uniref:SDR family NAD(P)-dependent oxidoreductase n=1 Tax=Pyxidicoccus parkwayensis TaxID=2813578 RepID=A0ABX7P5A3_9BACT|nr:SDR family NAD(P)-dependent oxidoreductase [Pyxidicoccus parkwaysis]QSQ25572.1 SDR family NAD(P)-dependent oxidoreductase [Pyxidicoccus parkwaysis]
MTSIVIPSVQTLLRYDDPVVRDHRVHGVRILPGVVYLDGLCRIAQAAGIAPEQLELSDILFETPVALSEGFDQRILFRTESVDNGVRVRISARREKSGQDLEAGEEAIASCTLRTKATNRLVQPLDLASLRGVVRSGVSLDAIYERTERLGIQHRDFMRTRGTVQRVGDRVIAELSLGDAALRRREDFFLHPAFLDTSTIIPFIDPHSEHEAGSAYIPMFIHAFRAWGRSGDTVYVETRAGAAARERDVLETDLRLYDADGRLIAEYERLTVKRVRSDDLIRRLTASASRPAAVDSRPAPAPSVNVSAAVPAQTRRARIVEDLSEMVANIGHLPRGEVTPSIGFYDLGLESSHLLMVAKTLEGRVGKALYPTLLFEYQTIDALAGYLDAQFGAEYRVPIAGIVREERPAESVVAKPSVHPDDQAMFFGFDWEPSSVHEGAPRPLESVLVFEDEGLRFTSASGTRLVRVRRGARFEAAGDTFTLNPAEPGDFRLLFRQLQSEHRSFSAVLYLWGRGAGARFLEKAFLPFRDVARALAEPGTVSERLYAFLPDNDELSRACAAALGGFARSARLEVPRLAFRSILMDATAERDLLTVAAREAALDTPETEVRYARGVRHVRRLAPLEAPRPARALRRGSVVLITGGLGGLGRLTARRLAAKLGAKLVLTGRRERDDEVDAFCSELRALGGDALYVRADVASVEDAARAVRVAREHFGALHAVLHAAGVLRDGFMRGASREAAEEVVRPKVAGAINLTRAAAGDDLELIAFYSALAAVAGNPGQSDYAAANRFLDAFAEEQEALRLRGAHRHRTVSINLPLWSGGGMGVSASQAEALRKGAGLGLLPDEAGLDILEACLAEDRAQVTVVWGEPAKVHARPEFKREEPAAASPSHGHHDREEPSSASRSQRHLGREAPPDISHSRRLDIAVVGMSGRYPGASDLDELWRNLEAGRDSVTEIPSDRWPSGTYPTDGAPLCRFGGFLSDVDKFDPLFFRIPPGTAAFLDPQERLFLETAYGAVENAGYKPEDFTAPRNRVGVFVGVMWGDYRLIGADAARQGAPVATSSLFSSTANRVSYFFDFVGPSMAVDTACSSSLTALHLACTSIARGECDAAIAGGVNLLLHPDKYLLLRRMNMTSSDGRCRSFGAGGDGYVPGEGVGALFLKPLERALADGDTIHGVIRGTAVNHGGRAAGYTVPHPVAQAEAIRLALEASEVDPDSIGYIEAHGTGTSLGDPVEIVGLSRAFEGRTRPLAVGSVKSNIGHLESAAGVAAVTRALLQLRHGRIAPSLHSQTLNPAIDFASTPFRVPQVAEPWPRLVGPKGEVPRRAGVSSFGAGGSNAHVVVEEFIDTRPVVPSLERELLVLSARSQERLRVHASRMARYLRTTDRTDFANIARTLQVGRPALDARLALVAENVAQAADLLERHLAGSGSGVFTGTAETNGDASVLVDRYRFGDLEGVAALWVRGTAADWSALNGGPRRRVPLPGQPLERKRFWIDVPTAAPTVETGFAAQVRRAFEQGLTPTSEELERGQQKLGHYAAAALYRRFRTMGFPSEGETRDVRTLKEQLGVRDTFARFFDACLEILERHGSIAREGEHVRVLGASEDPARLREELLSRFPELTPYLRLLDTCLDAYPETLRGQRAATAVLFPNASLELTSAIYRDSRAYSFTNDLVARLLVSAVQVRASTERRPFRILEIGAGTGGTSRAVLEALARLGADVEVHYTDISGGFVAHGRETFGKAYPFTRFRILDLEKDPVAQGFSPASFDAVFSANAVHAVADIDEALARIKTLLVPDGLLVLSEATTNTEALALTFGLLDGWHRYRDPERRIRNAPLLSVDGWRQTLTRIGFRGFTAYGPGLSADAELSQRVIVAGSDGAVPVQAPVKTETVSPSAPVPAPMAPARERPEALERAIAVLVAEGLGASLEDIRPERSFSEYGVDSILAVKIVERLNTRFGLSLKSTVLFDHPSVRALARHAAAQGARVQTETPSSPEPTDAAQRGPARTERTASPESSVSAQEAPGHFGAPTASVPSAASQPARTHVEAPTSSRTAMSSTARPLPGRSLDIAVVGMSGRFPGARDYRELWANLAAGRDSVTEVPPERWNFADHFQPWPPAPGKTYSKWGGYLSDVDRFDPLFFNIVPAEADFMDPQQRLFLQESWKALEDAGLDASRLARARCGVFVGATNSDYATLIRQRGLFGSNHVFTGNSLAILPARVSYYLNLKGPCFAVDTACSSSLVALHQACQSLASGECDLALAGGVSVFVTHEYHLLASSLGMLSPGGRCKSFDDSGDGFVIGEGAGVVVLKPLARALADGDFIHGVIKGIALNQDGRTNGITAPSSLSQAELEVEVYERFGIRPETLGYVETHGTGTKLGDPIEIEALTAAFRRYTDRRQFCAIGSIKSNIGHPSHAAGVASLIKVLLALRERRLPPSLHFRTPNRLIDFDSTPFFVNTELRDWTSEGPRRAAISSFGFSGTNCHLVVEEHTESRPRMSRPARPQLVPLSARTEDSLRRYAKDLGRFIEEHPRADLADLAATLQTGRSTFEHRTAIVADSVEELRTKLAAVASGTLVPGVYSGTADPDAQPDRVQLTPEADSHRTATAWASGAAFDFAGLHAGAMPRRIPLPTYSFEDERCWLPEVEARQVTRTAMPSREEPATPDTRTAESRQRSEEAARTAAPTPREPSTPDTRTAVRLAAAAQLSVAAGELDFHAPSEELGFDDVTRAALVERLNCDLGTDLRADAFSVGTTLTELSERLASAHIPPKPRLPEAVMDRPRSSPEAKVIDSELFRRAEDYMKRALAEAFRLPPERLRTRALLQDYGIDSVLINKFNKQLEATFGALPKTLFFEYQTIHDLAGYLVQHHGARLAAVLDGPTVGMNVPSTVAPPQAVAPPPTPVRESPKPRVQDIAVIGMSGRYPMARDNDELWENLLAGRDGIVEIPKDRWDHSQYFSEDKDEPGATYAKWGGFLSDVDKFDPRFFNLSPKEAEVMDPQQRLFLETAWAALEDAGYTPRRISESARARGKKDAGVFAGVIYGEYSFFVDIPIAGYWAVPNRVSYHFGFNGPSFAVDTACSASLTAIHLACESLRRGECAYAIAGGVNVSVHPGKYLLMSYGRFASSDGRCRSFGAGGDGYVPGEGVVALLLKPLQDAREDGDRIYGVIRSSTINHGGRTNGFTVPSPNAQANLITEALEEAGINPRDLSYVEAHGTGTALGDPIELAALTKAYRRFTQDRRYCAIGSAKSNIGHLEAAAGATGIVKTLLQLQHETLVPSLHSETVNPNLDFDSSPFYLVRDVRPWPRGAGGDTSQPRLASVSSFGAGGSNAHVIIEEHLEAPRPAVTDGGPHLILLSARREERLHEAAKNLLRFLRSERGAKTPLGDIAWTLMVGREAFEHRLAVVASSHEELVARLEDFVGGRKAQGTHAGVARTHRDTDDIPGEAAPDREYLRNLYESSYLMRLAEFWSQGWVIDWEELRGARRGRVVSLPSYPFARERYWIVPEEFRRKGVAPNTAPVARLPAVVEPVVQPRVEPVKAAPAPVAAAAPFTPPPADGDFRARLQAQVKSIFAELTKLPESELDVDADFFDFGFDSVASVRMLNRLMKVYGARVPATAMQEYNTIRTFVNHVVDAGYIKEDSAPVPAQAAHSGAPVANAAVPASTPVTEKLTRTEPFPVENIFITGVTGVLGGKLLHDLLTTTNARISCLVRGDSLEQARKRIQYFVETYDPEGRLAEAFRQRVTPILGDVTFDHFGLDAAAYARLAAETDVTFHAAGKTTLVTFYEALAPINVEGTRRVIDFALLTKHRYMVYVSSFSALGDRLNFNNPPFTERDLELGQGYDHLPYQETKYQAEKLIRAATERGLVWNIFRPGNIMGDGHTGRYPFAEVSVKGVYYDIFKTVIESGLSMMSPVHWDITPVDYVSSAMIHLALRRPSYRETYHLTNPDIRRYYDVVNHLREHGYDIQFTSIDDFFKLANERRILRKGTNTPYDSQTLEMFKYGVEIFGKIHYEESSYANCAYTRSILGPAGIDCPTIAQLIPVYLEHCIAVGYLPPPDTRMPVTPGAVVNGARARAG